MMKLISVLGFVAVLIGCSTEQGQEMKISPDVQLPDRCAREVLDPVTVSIAAVIADPERFEGRAIAVVGFLSQSFEHSAIYLHREDFIQSIAQNGIWVEGPDIPTALNNRYVRLEGIFTTTQKGHFSMWPGTICNVERSVAWGQHGS